MTTIIVNVTEKNQSLRKHIARCNYAVWKSLEARQKDTKIFDHSIALFFFIFSFRENSARRDGVGERES